MLGKEEEERRERKILDQKFGMNGIYRPVGRQVRANGQECQPSPSPGRQLHLVFGYKIL